MGLLGFWEIRAIHARLSRLDAPTSGVLPVAMAPSGSGAVVTSGAQIVVAPGSLGIFLQLRVGFHDNVDLQIESNFSH